MQVSMLEVKSQLSRLVKAALSGEEVIIASHGKGPGEAGPVCFRCRSQAAWISGGGLP
jgi:hypothetical protein